MKARLIRDTNAKLKILYADGTIAVCTDSLLYSFFVDFNANNSLHSGQDGNWNDMYPEITMVPGSTVAFITDQQELVVKDIKPFKKFLANDLAYRNFLSVPEFGKKHNSSEEIVKVYCRAGRIKGARKVGRTWIIPENAEWPVEPSRRNPAGGRKPKKNSL